MPVQVQTLWAPLVLCVAALGAGALLWTAPDRLPSRDGADLSRLHPAAEPPEPPARDATPRMYRHGAHHAGQSRIPGPVAGRLKWRFDAGGRITGQAVVGPRGRIYFSSHAGKLHVLGPDGRLIWERSLGAVSYGGPLVDSEGNVYVGTDAGRLLSFDPLGEQRLALSVDGPVDSAPTQSPLGPILFAAGRTLHAVDTSGRELWRYQAHAKIFTTPAVSEDGQVFFGAQDHQVYALSAEGRLRWYYRTGSDVDSSLLLDQYGTVYLGSDDGHVYALTSTGKLRWARLLPAPVRAPLALGLGGASIIAVVHGLRPMVLALESTTGVVSWRHRLTMNDSPQAGVRSGPLVDGQGRLFFGAYDDQVYAFDASGRELWRYATKGHVGGSPVIGPDSTLYIGSDDGHLYAFAD